MAVCKYKPIRNDDHESGLETGCIVRSLWVVEARLKLRRNIVEAFWFWHVTTNVLNTDNQIESRWIKGWEKKVKVGRHVPPRSSQLVKGG